MDSFDYEMYLKYFYRDVLNFYRLNSHIYRVVEDDMGGEIHVTDNFDKNDENKYPYISLKFGFRKLKDNTTCIALFTYYYEKKISNKDYWDSFKIVEPEFLDNDPNFKRWIDRYFFGSWEIRDGPKFKILRVIELISVLTKHVLGIPFFKYNDNILFNYPNAENTDAYTKANLELYRLIIDGMQKDAIIRLSKYLEKSLTDKDKRLNSLKELLPDNEIETIHEPFIKLKDKRARIHGLPTNGINEFNAFDEFDKDLHNISICLESLLEWLEDVLNTDAKSCKDREDSLSLFPEIIAPPRPESKNDDIKKAVGRKIKSIEFGEVKECEDVHESEAIVFHFDDDTSMAIVVGSNAQDVQFQNENITPNEFSTDLMIFWANAIKRKS